MNKFDVITDEMSLMINDQGDLSILPSECMVKSGCTDFYDEEFDITKIADHEIGYAKEATQKWADNSYSFDDLKSELISFRRFVNKINAANEVLIQALQEIDDNISAHQHIITNDE